MNQKMEQKDFLRLEYTKTGSNYKLHLYFATDERGIVYRVTSVLFANDWNILGASIRSLENGQVEDEFLIQHSLGLELNEEEIQKLKIEMQQLFREEISITSYIIKKGKLNPSSRGNKNSIIEFESIENLDCTRMKIQTDDRAGLLWDISRLLYLECIDILNVQAKTKGKQVDDIFEIKSEAGHLLDESMKERLIRNLKNIL